MISCLIYVLSLIVPPSYTSVDGNQNDNGIILGLSSTAIAIIAGIAIIIILLLIVICCIIAACCCLRYIYSFMDVCHYISASACSNMFNIFLLLPIQERTWMHTCPFNFYLCPTFQYIVAMPFD